MLFLDKLAHHPALQVKFKIWNSKVEKLDFLFQKNLLDLEAEDKSKDIENVLKEIRGTARDGLSFLKVLQLLITLSSVKDAMHWQWALLNVSVFFAAKSFIFVGGHIV